MKAYFTFKTFRKTLVTFIIIMTCTVIGQFRDGYWSVEQIVATDLALAGMYVLVSLVIDWVSMKRKGAKE